MQYYGAVYRPPSEANSLIIQATLGCSQNTCTFCGMYKNERFIIRPKEEVLKDLQEMSAHADHVRRVFLADGDALIIPTDTLVTYLETIKELYPYCQKVGVYASPKSIQSKTPEDLKLLHSKGLTIAYLGLESGSNKILKAIKKGVTAEEMIACCQKLNEADILTSVTVISGLGGRQLMEEHAVETGKVLSAMQADYIGLLTLILEPSTPLYKDHQEGRFTLLTSREVLLETRKMIEHISSPGTIFRSNHASNYIALRGTFDDDKEKLLKSLDLVLKENAPLSEKFRML
ncbi:MAG: B12-binding domain-containing radical SAM protein [Eubacteriaceae bacterium]|jgi:radical SAM superfamily enzyme YgiQ (UPF0313 family)|nr:B12-binding domain-containing radical SAM protein [Eubacteriaceae bacterium]